MPSFKRRVADGLGSMMGVKIIPNGSVDDWLEKRFIGRLMTALGVDCVFDVGANKGQFGQMLRASGYLGTILSFEPGPSAFAYLQSLVQKDSAWEAFNIGLGAIESKMPLRVMKSDVFSSFRAPSQKEDTSYSDENQVVAVTEVEVKRLDDLYESLASRFGFSRPFLKMDTQGFDLEIINGAEQTLPRFVGLSSEIAIRRLYEDSPTMIQSVHAIIERGFDFVNLLPVHPGRLLNPLELNSFAVRRDLAR